MTDYPHIDSQRIGWGPGKAVFNVGDTAADFDVDACLSLHEGGAGVTPDNDPTTVASLGIHVIDEPNHNTIYQSSFIELTPSDCLNLATWLLKVVEQANKDHDFWITRDRRRT